MQIAHILGKNGVRREFKNNSSKMSLPENDDSEAFDSILPIGHRLSCNGVKKEF